ncbi:DUF4468 domain-containing protein [Flavobacterium psychrophilum]|uniref:DUF4468 domain-containing protein n=5 Tax=root TaxID=1 RepID=A6GXQ7_FLAPJ|nr:DUF4468 domain-containing protein [Flavobacterium psychrophilum]YP_008320419.1 DUF4468 domain-containing protein [Flavobacterium phage 6H]YP_009321829.1 DUF4468 domain-containing protein [Flavobacterium phage 1H]YP_009322879.1 DUF4468 domain-containing protein [Flavobacterium phage 2A]YP_009592313.1 DUF4468 domain-containing protein [Flavobacterium phage 23T]QCW20231.1 DUF4468 domain-containing protein [Flavobacterium phage FPSV-F7]AGN89388.1 hypothetical protein [Flavobacterium phage 6H]
MKKIILLFALFPLLMFSQESSGKLTYKNVIKVDSLKKSSQLYMLSRSWFAEKYNSAKDVIQFEDKEEGKIIARGSFNYNSNVFVYSNATKGHITYTLTIIVKDGRYKYEASNFTHQGNPENIVGDVSFGLITSDEECPYNISAKGWRNRVWRDLKEQIDGYINPIIISLNKYIASAVVKEEEKW